MASLVLVRDIMLLPIRSAVKIKAPMKIQDTAIKLHGVTFNKSVILIR